MQTGKEEDFLLVGTSPVKGESSRDATSRVQLYLADID